MNDSLDNNVFEFITGYLPDSVAAKMAASAFLTTGKIQGFPSAVRYAPTPRLTYEISRNIRHIPDHSITAH